MKLTPFIATAILAYCASAAPVENKLPITTSPHSNSSSILKDPLLSNATAYNEALIQCEQLLTKPPSLGIETTALLEIDGHFNAHDACVKIFANIYPERDSNDEKSLVRKRSELNMTYIESWKSQGLTETDEEDKIPGAAFKQTFHTKELYSMASLAQSYWANACYDLESYESTYNTDSDAFNYVSEEFQTCKEDVDAMYEELKGDIKVFLESRKVFDVKHGKEFRGAVKLLRNMNYSCGGNGDCFAGALRKFVHAVNEMPVEMKA
ncbi:uncharacterized protein PAC_06447 [Phialocephala subalpina]|uniref:Uncharacterized protein n=1 Tax=Phialocephala subalpina TaxID=576137 RepID=A0A1L7WUW6_9HELO|nr:uncharacterized protein PAC_06447 [Phialocephala subalpina]